MKMHTFTENDLASANEQAIRANERAKVIAEVESWLIDERARKYITDLAIRDDFEGVKGLIRNELRAELRAKLAEMERLKTIIGGYCWSQDGGSGGYGFEDIEKHIDKIVATALEEQRMRYVEEVQELTINQREFGTDYIFALDDVLAILGGEK